MWLPGVSKRSKVTKVNLSRANLCSLATENVASSMKIHMSIMSILVRLTSGMWELALSRVRYFQLKHIKQCDTCVIEVRAWSLKEETPKKCLSHNQRMLLEGHPHTQKTNGCRLAITISENINLYHQTYKLLKYTSRKICIYNINRTPSNNLYKERRKGIPKLFFFPLETCTFDNIQMSIQKRSLDSLFPQVPFNQNILRHIEIPTPVRDSLHVLYVNTKTVSRTIIQSVPDIISTKMCYKFFFSETHKFLFK